MAGDDCDSDCGDCDKGMKCGNLQWYVGCGVGWGIVLFSLIIASLSRVQFDEYAFAKPWGGKIDQTKVFTQGVHFLGFWNDLVVFPADVIDLQLESLSVFSFAQGEDGGTSLVIDVGIQYKLDPDFLSDLFDIGGQTGYINQIKSVAIETIKNNATEFNADTYLTDRRRIEASFRAVTEKTIREAFANTEIINLQLLAVVFPDSFYQRKLDVGLQEIRNEIQAFNRQTTQVRDTTKRKVVVIENEAKKVVETAKAEALLITTRAANEFERVVGQAKEEGMRILADALNISSEKDFLSMNYLVQILNNAGRQRKFVNFGDLPPATSLV